MSAHTPGPWKLSAPKHSLNKTCGHSDCTDPAHQPNMIGYDLYGQPTADNHSPWVASIHGQHVRIPLEQAHANARMIAAAPELLQALQLLHANVAEYARINNLGGFDNQDMRMAHAAIAKAVAK